MSSQPDTIIVISHILKDFNKWKAVFDSKAHMRQRAQIKVTSISRSVENPNQYIMIMHAPSAKAAQLLLQDPELARSMLEAEILGPPRIEVATLVARPDL